METKHCGEGGSDAIRAVACIHLVQQPLPFESGGDLPQYPHLLDARSEANLGIRAWLAVDMVTLTPPRNQCFNMNADAQAETLQTEIGRAQIAT